MINTENQSVLVFGEVLFDCFPDREVLGGAPFNVAWHLHGFGIKVKMLSAVGKDSHGDRVLERMKSWGMDTSGIQIRPEQPTGKVKIEMNKDGGHRFEICADQAYDRILADEALNSLDDTKPEMICHGSLALRTPAAMNEFLTIKNRTQAKSFLDINLREPWWTQETNNQLIDSAQVLKLNDDELRTITESSLSDPKLLQEAAQKLMATRNLQRILVTCGTDGAFLIDGKDEPVTSSAAPVEKVEDTVGAGDAFTSVALLGLLKGWEPDILLKRATEFASKICGIRGATTDDGKLYKNTLKSWS